MVHSLEKTKCGPAENQADCEMCCSKSNTPWCTYRKLRPRHPPKTSRLELLPVEAKCLKTIFWTGIICISSVCSSQIINISDPNDNYQTKRQKRQYLSITNTVFWFSKVGLFINQLLDVALGRVPVREHLGRGQPLDARGSFSPPCCPGNLVDNTIHYTQYYSIYTILQYIKILLKLLCKGLQYRQIQLQQLHMILQYTQK